MRTDRPVAKADRQVVKRPVHMTPEDKSLIRFGIDPIDALVDVIPPVQRYMRHYDNVAPELWMVPPSPDMQSMGFAGAVMTKRQSALQRNAMRLGVTGVDRGVGYLLNRHTNMNPEKFNVNVRPTLGGAYVNFRFTFKDPF